VVLIDLARLAAASLDEPSSADREAADAIVASEVEAFLSWLRGSDVAPTVAALRARADEVVESELSRLSQRRPDLTPDQRADVAHAIHRVVQRLLHSPTVRVRQLAGKPGGDQYAALLRELFDLAVPDRADNLTRAVDVESDRETS
jgi:glutamyl-tRNA reductase